MPLKLCAFIYNAYTVDFYFPAPTSSDSTHTHTHAKYQNIPLPEFRVASSMATIHWPQSPWQQASALLTLFLLTNFLFVCCVCLCVSLLLHWWVFSCFLARNQPNLNVVTESLLQTGRCVSVMCRWDLRCQLPLANCPWDEYWAPKIYNRPKGSAAKRSVITGYSLFVKGLRSFYCHWISFFLG